jgi:regulator of sigma E protease
MLNLIAFVVALGILVAVHEWGHFYVARLCGVRVEKFSVGFGKALWRKTDKHGTEFVIAAIPLGGYVRMLDERVDNVPSHLREQAFNNKSVLQRMAIIAAGPAVNLVFAFFALMLMFMLGISTVRPIVGSVDDASIAGRGGVFAGAEIVAVNGRLTPDWDAVSMELLSAIGQQQVQLTVVSEALVSSNIDLPLSDWAFDPDKASIFESIGIMPFRPLPTMTLGLVADDSAAKQAGLQVNDTITAVDGEAISDWYAFSKWVSERPGESVVLTVARDQQIRQLTATIERRDTEYGQRGVLGVSPLFTPWPEGYLLTQQFGLFDATERALAKTWRLISLSVEMLVKLVSGDVSVKSLSGPISIAQGAGASASIGLAYFLSFLALISVNLGVINLLPLPMLDGGHLMYFLIEWVRGKPVPEHVQEWGFRVGATVLLFVMLLAITNDIGRLL